MSYADYEICPGCDGKAVYMGEGEFPDGVTAWHDVCLQKRIAEAVAAERARLYAELGNDHYVIFTEDGWTTEHSVECRLSGRMSECEYHTAMARVIGRGAPVAGRWRITGISEGLPDLERAEAPTDD